MEVEYGRLEPLFIWFEETALGAAVRDSVWAFAVIESVHLLGLCLLGGALLIVDLRLMGYGLRHQSIRQVAAAARPWLLAGIAIMVLTGVPLMLSEAIKTYYNTAFWVKIITLPFALLFTFTLRARVVRKASIADSITRLTAFVSVSLWITVAAAGRWIGFS